MGEGTEREGRMIYSVVFKGYTDGKLTHESRISVDVEDREQAVWMFHHSVPDTPPEVKVRIDWRTLRCEKENDFKVSMLPLLK